MSFATVFFFACLFGVVYSYAIYPLLLAVVPGKAFLDPVKDDDTAMRFTLIITAYNEEARIERKLLNTNKVDYPTDHFDIIVASDCSDDETDAIVRRYENERTRLIRADKRLGKEGTQALAIAEASGDILVFSDVGTELPGNALHELRKLFSNMHIGAVSSEDKFITRDGETAGEGLYVKYEMWLRQLESKRAGLVGLSGSFFAARSTICERWDTLSPSDFNTALNCVRQGFTAISSSRVLGIYPDIQNSDQEYSRKVRTVLRGMTGLFRNTDMLNIWRYPLFSFQLWSHKIMRWLVPWFLIGLAAATAVKLRQDSMYLAALIPQLAFYATAIFAHVVPRIRRITFIRIIYYFAQVNLAIANATVRFFFGHRMTTWTPSVRQ